jgi:outer membrane immunogenic protein
MIRRFALATTALLCMAGAAAAADLPTKKAPEPPPPLPFSWTGFYVGGNLGVIDGRFADPISTTAFVGAFPFGPDSVPFNGFDNSLAGGVQLGYRQQFQQFVLGVEANFDLMNLNRSVVNPAPGTGRDVFIRGDNFAANARWDSSIRGDLGYAWDRWLVYATGGVAFTGVTMSSNFIATTVGAITFPASSGSDSKTLIGGTIGAGVAYALNDHWDVGAEYRFTDYGRAKFALGTVAGGFFGGAFENVPATGSLNVQTQQVELKVNYRF